jgi:acetoin utilization deacetylase AcuC-like enzyme
MRVYTNPLQSRHTVPAGFPEIPERIAWAETACADLGLQVRSPSREALDGVDTATWILATHSDHRMERLEEGAVPTRARLDTSDCPVSPGTPEAALAAVQVTLLALTEILRTEEQTLVLTRPPGHHATRTMAMGFCYLNNVAIAARMAAGLGHSRIAIYDFDVHHGNGTQEIFYTDGEIFFCSQHEDPRTQYPGTGFVHERGAEAGLGATLNITHPTNTAGPAWLRDFEEQAFPALAGHRPELLLISAGFDTHEADPLGGLKLRGEDFQKLGGGLARLAKGLKVPALLLLEGGYDPLCFSDGLRPFLEGWLAEG